MSQALWAEVINLSHPRVKVFMVHMRAKPVKQGLTIKSDTVPRSGSCVAWPGRGLREMSRMTIKMLHQIVESATSNYSLLFNDTAARGHKRIILCSSFCGSLKVKI